MPLPALLIALAAPAAAPPVVVRGAPPGRPLVVIDPGHGGHDPGTIGIGGTAEKAIVLALAREVRDALVRGRRVRVALTREDDRFVDLPHRPAIARRLGATLLVSIHADSGGGAGAHGASIYTLSDTASDAEAARLATRENRAGGAAARPAVVAAILGDLAQRGTMAESGAFARGLVRHAAGRVPFRMPAHRFANFSVLRSAGVPAVLVETGYLSNPDDARRLATPAGRRPLVDALAAAIEAQLARAAIRR